MEIKNVQAEKTTVKTGETIPNVQASTTHNQKCIFIIFIFLQQIYRFLKYAKTLRKENAHEKPNIHYR